MRCGATGGGLKKPIHSAVDITWLYFKHIDTGVSSYHQKLSWHLRLCFYVCDTAFHSSDIWCLSHVKSVIKPPTRSRWILSTAMSSEQLLILYSGASLRKSAETPEALTWTFVWAPAQVTAGEKRFKSLWSLFCLRSLHVWLLWIYCRNLWESKILILHRSMKEQSVQKQARRNLTEEECRLNWKYHERVLKASWRVINFWWCLCSYCYTPMFCWLYYFTM